jgi:hypothetical protein
MKKLSKKELNELKGGIDYSAPGGDTENHNNVSGCICKYNNASSVTNTNDVGGCSCTCTLSS